MAMSRKEIDALKQDIRITQELLRQALILEECANSLRSFVKHSWPVIEPGTTYVHGWHIDAITDHLEAVVSGEIKRLIINIPPRCMKSTLCSITLPAWCWIKAPERKFLYSSYDLKLSMRDSRKCRALIGSAWYQRVWAEKFKILTSKGGQDTKQRFDNDKGGYRVATATNVGTTGEGGDIICLHGDSLISTNEGPIPIRDIVEKRLKVKVLGSSGKWRNITDFQKTPGRPSVSLAISTGGSLICTEDHPVFVESYGYVPAMDVISSCHDPHLRRLRNDFRPSAETCGAFNSWSILFQSLLRKVLHWANEPGMVWRPSFEALRSVWSGISMQTWGGEAALALPGLCDSTPSAANDTMRDLWGGVSFKTFIHETKMLLESLRWATSERGSEWSLSPWQTSKQIFRGMESQTSGDNSKAGWEPLRYMPRSKATFRTSHRWFKDKPRSNEFGNPLQRLSSEGSHQTGNQPRGDEAVRVDSIRRCETPDFVYNITVEHDHDYYANGILAHNCYDDPNDLGEMTSDAYIEQVIYFHEHVMASRLNDPKTGARVCIQQRCSERDMTGHILEKEAGWEHLVIPMEYEGSKKVTSIGWADPRKEHGELMWPQRIGPAEIVELKKNPIAWAGQYQQRPSPGEGAKFKREWFQYWNPRSVDVQPETGKFAPVRVEIPGSQQPIYRTPVHVPAAFEQVVLSFDCAFKDAEENDFVAGHAWGRVGANCYLIGHVYEHLDFVKTLAAFRKMSADFPCPEKLIEDKANGPAVVSTLRNEIPGIIPIEPEGGKIARANAITPYVESGNVFLPNPDLYPWVRDFVEQCANFPRAKHDDEVDAMTQALRRLYDTQANAALPEFRVSPRVGEPQSACHVLEGPKMHLEPHWRRWVAMVPGCALWLCETPTGSMRVYRELDLAHVDGHEAGRRIAEESLKDVRARMRLLGHAAVWVCEILMEKDLFKPMEPIGCLAELVADGAQSYKLEQKTFEDRETAKSDMSFVRFSAEMVELREGAWDRLRDLLRFQPPEFQKIDYDRNYAMDLFHRSPDQWRDYMAQVEGEPNGEWPKVKFSSECPKTLAAIGTASRLNEVREIAEPFLRALLVGITTPDNVAQVQGPREIPWGANGPKWHGPHKRRLGLRIAV